MSKNYFPADYRVIAKLIGANFNSTADQQLVLQISDSDDVVKTNEGNYMMDRIVVTNASTSLTTAAGGVYIAAAKAGTPIVAAAQVYTALTSSVKWVALTLASIALTDVMNAATQSLYFSLTTPQGAAATADIYVYGRMFQK